MLILSLHCRKTTSNGQSIAALEDFATVKNSVSSISSFRQVYSFSRSEHTIFTKVFMSKLKTSFDSAPFKNNVKKTENFAKTKAVNPRYLVDNVECQ